MNLPTESVGREVGVDPSQRDGFRNQRAVESTLSRCSAAVSRLRGMIANPLTNVPPGQLRRVAVPAFVAFLLASLPFFLLIDAFKDLSRLQLAGSEPDAERIIASWQEADIRDVAFLQGLDHVIPLTYGALLAAGAVWAGRRLRGRVARLAPAFAWMAVGAALCDLLENVGMVLMIRGDIDSPIPAVTSMFAVAKYSLLVATLLYVVAGVVSGGSDSRSRPSRNPDD